MRRGFLPEKRAFELAIGLPRAPAAAVKTSTNCRDGLVAVDTFIKNPIRSFCCPTIDQVMEPEFVVNPAKTR
jgi:hypothetical protein